MSSDAAECLVGGMRRRMVRQMRVLPRLGASRSSRLTLLVTLCLLAVVSVVLVWNEVGPVGSVALGLGWLFAILLTRALLEVVLDLRTLAQRVGRAERKLGDQPVILDRVRRVEQKVGDQAGFNDGILARVRRVESGVAQAVSPPGRERRVQLLRDQLERANSAIQGSAAFQALDMTITPRAQQVGLSVGATSRSGPLVSIVVPCFNDEAYVGDTLASIHRQSMPDWECIVVDDCSSDRSVEAVEEAVAQDERFQLVRHTANRGVPTARNTALQRATGTFVVFHDADDLMMADSLKDRVEVAAQETDPDVAGVFCGVRIADVGVSLSDLPTFEPWKPRHAFADFVSSAGECPFPVQAGLVRRDLVLKHGGFDERMVVAEDWDLWVRILRKGFFFKPARLRTVIYRQTPSSIAQTRALTHVEESNRLIDAAHGEAPPFAEDEPVASYPFPLALSHYQRLITRSKRAIQYASTTLLRGDADATWSILHTLERGAWPLLSRHIDIDAVATDGFRRASGIDLTDLDHVDNDLAHIRDVVRAAVRAVTE